MYDCEDTLTVKRDLLNPNFDGYKLSLDAMPKYHVKLPTGVDVVQLSEDQYTVHHVRIFGLTNHLVLDPWNPDLVYFVDRHWNVRQLKVTVESQLDSPCTVFNIPNIETQHKTKHLNISFAFPLRDLCILSDGAGELYILSTVNRGESDAPKWKILWKGEFSETNTPCIIQHAVFRQCSTFTEQQDADIVYIECLLLHIDKEADSTETLSQDNIDDAEKEPAFATYLEWITFKRNSGNDLFDIHQRRTYKGTAAPLHCAVEETGKAVYISGEGQFNIIYDSLKAVKEEDEEEKKDKDKEEEDQKDPMYTWTQTHEDITLTFPVPSGTTKSHVSVVLTSKHLKLGLLDGSSLLEGPLFRDIDVETTTWILDGRKLELTLGKRENEMLIWSEVVIGDTTGEYFVDPDQARIVHERLAHLTSDELNPKTNGNKSSSTSANPQMLEECDSFPENFTSMVRFDGEGHKVTNAVNIGTNHWLFNAQIDPHKASSICLRHDVDGILWQPGIVAGTTDAWSHTATFNALGYVQASKRDKKFASCPPDMSYAALCDCVRHIYVYRQPQDTLSPIRNRKSGEVVKEVSKQQLVSLHCQDNILGMQTTNERIFVLTGQRLYVIRVKNKAT